MNYKHEFRVKASIAEVVAFHQRSASMSAITPPPVRVQVHHAPVVLQNGDRMEFSLSIGPIRLPWSAHIEDIFYDGRKGGFTDRQLSGPFKEWTHQHSFQQIDQDLTLVIDHVTATFKPTAGGNLVGWSMWLGMPLLFAYRGWKTRALLEQ